MDLPWLREAYNRTRKDGAVGVDGQTAEEYAERLEQNLESMLDRVKAGQYRGPSVRRVHIPKGGGKTRPIGIPTFEDKVLQRAVVMLLEPIFEQDFYDGSYGFQPGRSTHDALEALNKKAWEMRGGWVLDVDIENFFDSVDHKKLQEMIRRRVAELGLRRLIGRWLKAGVMEEGAVRHPETGVPQGGVISPLLANIYLHEVIDKWWVDEVLPRMRGRAELIRYADDFVIVFSNQGDAERVFDALPKRLERFGLRLHPQKTRLVCFQRPPRNGGGGGGTRPESFDFLGLTHYWGRAKEGYWALKRKTSKSRFSRACRVANQWLRHARHLPIAEQAAKLGRKLQGHFNYYGVVGNSRGIARFHQQVLRLWRKWLSRRSQRSYITWQVFVRLLKRHPLPRPRLPLRHRQLRLANV
jgi:group II intron reverse transcriptase/maturase